MIAITGATGQLGHYVIKSLMKTVPASQIVAIVRNPAKAQALTAQGITVRQADYGDEAALTSALQGVEKLLLISSSEVGQRAPQHRNVINAAKAAGVKFIAYTSLLHADNFRRSADAGGDPQLLHRGDGFYAAGNVPDAYSLQCAGGSL